MSSQAEKSRLHGYGFYGLVRVTATTMDVAIGEGPATNRGGATFSTSFHQAPPKDYSLVALERAYLAPGMKTPRRLISHSSLMPEFSKTSPRTCSPRYSRS